MKYEKTVVGAILAALTGLVTALLTASGPVFIIFWSMVVSIFFAPFMRHVATDILWVYCPETWQSWLHYFTVITWADSVCIFFVVHYVGDAIQTLTPKFVKVNNSSSSESKSPPAESKPATPESE